MTKVYTAIVLPLFLLGGIMYYNFGLGQENDTTPPPDINKKSVCTETVLITLNSPLECIGDTDASLLATVTRSPECNGTYMYFFHWKRDGTDVRFELKDFGQLTDELIDIQPGGGPLTPGMYEVIVQEQFYGGPNFQDLYTLIVNDITPPTLSCPGNISSGTDIGECSAIVNFSSPIANDNCDGNFPSVQTLGLPSGSPFPVGTSIIEFSATDSSGNTQTCSFGVTVTDDDPPQLICPGNISSGTDIGECSAIVNFSSPIANDNCDGNFVAVQTLGLPSGSQFPVGTSMIEFSATDSSGNTQTCSFNVIVTDDESPQLICPLNQTVEIMTPDQYVLPDYFNTGEATATDNCAVTITSQDPLPGTMLGEGIYTISFTALDDAGNESNCSFQLTVDDILGVGDFSDTKDVQIYPNPVSGHFNIVVPDNSEIKKVTLFSTNGKLICEWIPNASNVFFSVDMAGYTDQMYFVRIETGTTIVFKKVVKD